ncbi:MAG: Ni-sirohydrochlorin a,c-diamide reductive cyclase catalytic subunit [Candidatus Methanodesulfokora washburnensis]|jgi:putative methanogenesis marker 13 metalloprotein|nr:Ni-sirohydrochlorin a,c-diamide reductive cyclase catalytic subunit [Candidatus Methanodesulfokores washburnensis]
MRLESISFPIHPRPSPIAAALYTLRDLNCKYIVLHGPPSCNFRAMRLLEKDGVKVFTTSMSDMDVILGGKEKLISVLRLIYSEFKPDLIGVVGTCCTTITGEDVEAEVIEAGINSKIIAVNISGCWDNTEGAIKVVEAAFRMGVIDEKEFRRQISVLRAATEVEKSRGVAMPGYITPSKGDDINYVAKEVLERLKYGVLVILNAKKETAYLYSDIVLALKEASDKVGGRMFLTANLMSDRGLPKVREDATRILLELKRNGLKVDLLSGGLDEYALAYRILELPGIPDFDSAVVIGVPQALDPRRFDYSVGVSSGERTMTRLRTLGYTRVINEEAAHINVLGKRRIVRSQFGTAIRRLL